MDRESYEEEMQKAEANLLIGERVAYWQGYQRGLQRQYHGESVVSKDEHIQWLSYLNDPSTKVKGKGYWDGLLA